MTQEVERRLERSFQAEAMNYEFFGGEANFKRMRLLGGIIHEVELITKASWVEDEHTKTKVIELAGAFLRMFGPELPNAGSQLERGFRDHEADRVLKSFVDLALDKRGPQSRARKFGRGARPKPPAAAHVERNWCSVKLWKQLTLRSCRSSGAEVIRPALSRRTGTPPVGHASVSSQTSAERYPGATQTAIRTPPRKVTY